MITAIINAGNLAVRGSSSIDIHKFRHGHIHYGSAHARTIEDFKAVSMNAMHSSMKITDEFYSNLNDGEVQKRIGALGTEQPIRREDKDVINLLEEFLTWKQEQKK